MLNTNRDFHSNDITVTSVINVINDHDVIKNISPGTAFCHSFSVPKRT